MNERFTNHDQFGDGQEAKRKVYIVIEGFAHEVENEEELDLSQFDRSGYNEAGDHFLYPNED